MNILEVEGLCKTYPAFALRDVSFAVEPGTIMGFIGRNGAGKSTLVRCINLLERPTSGTVRIDGRDMTQLSRRELLKAGLQAAARRGARRCGFLPE